ncbi:MAG: NAD(P)/FAD-dependent oxidoreductase [Deltaproteobacteria bacterium]|nr:NAD(P)/FAD-dependent oxidoreductase [Deltaproteobacteria bacterium]
MTSHPTQPHVVIIGGGFGGLAAARALRKAPVRITLIDRRNHHLFQPLLYQVATAALNPGDIAYPIRGALAKQKNARVLLADARSIDVAARRVELDGGALTYDYLIVATGATHSYFGKPWEERAPGLKSIEDALEIRRRVFLAYEAAEREADPAAQKAWLTFVVVGGGATGVELAGALGEIGLHTLAHDFRRIDSTTVRVLLVEGRDRVLPGFAPESSAAAQKALEKRHVEVRTGAIVTDIDDGGVTIATGSGDAKVSTRIEARTVLWAAGVQASPLARTLNVPLDRSGRVEVGADLAIPGHPEVFVIGDLAKMSFGADAKGAGGVAKEVPGVAQGALQSGAYVGAAIAREVRGDRAPRAAFRYNDKGSMATIGRAQAVVEIGRMKRSGFFAWLFWWVIHVMYLVGFRNRFAVMFQWMWSYLTFQRGARLITGPVGALPPVSGLDASGSPSLPAAAETVALDARADGTAERAAAEDKAS